MDTPTVKSALPDIVLPEQLRRGEMVVMHDKPFVIESVHEVSDPWTHRPGLELRGSESSIVYLILTCVVCGERAAMRFNASIHDLEWLEVRYQGRYYWLCPSHAQSIVQSIEAT